MQQANTAAAADDAAVAAALQPGADVHSLNGTAVLGKVKSFDDQNVVVTAATGDVSLPRSAFLMSSAGLSRSEEHTSELQSLMRISYAVFGLKKKIYKV